MIVMVFLSAIAVLAMTALVSYILIESTLYRFL